jgi:hypothetical protein
MHLLKISRWKRQNGSWGGWIPETSGLHPESFSLPVFQKGVQFKWKSTKDSGARISVHNTFLN